MLDLPIEVLVRIFLQLDPFTIARFRRVCHSFNSVLTTHPFSNLIALVHIGHTYEEVEVFCFVTPESFGEAFLTKAQKLVYDAHKAGYDDGSFKKYPFKNLKVLPINSRHILCGPLPRALGSMSKLTNDLNLMGSYVTGPPPSELGNLVHLKKLNLSGTLLDGTIPDSFGNLVNLELLGMSSAGLTGSIPASFCNLINLVELILDRNKLSGTVSDMFGGMARLQALILSNNKLEGPIPQSLGQCTQLTTLHCEENSFSGSIPVSIFRLPLLQSAKFEKNLISEIPPSPFNNASGNLF
ncbi:hypothetical protein HDU81_001460, partial [Chytriomyces hyalinus]